MGLNLKDLIPPQARLAIAAAGIAAAMTGGAWAWHHTPFIGPGAVIRGLNLQLGTATNTIADQGRALEAAQTAITDRDLALHANGETAASEAAQAGQFWRGQCRAAFEAGASYASKTCPPGPDGAAAGGPDAGQLRRDLRTLWANGAFRPATPAASGVSAQPEGGAGR